MKKEKIWSKIAIRLGIVASVVTILGYFWQFKTDEISTRNIQITNQNTTVKNQGDANETVINYGTINNIVEESISSKIKVDYYRLSGFSAQLLVQGILSPDLEKTLAGRHEIVSNEVLNEFKNLTLKFSDFPYGDVLYTDESKYNDPRIYLGDYIKSNKLPKYSWGKSSIWDSYMGARASYIMTVPDIKATKKLFETNKWPDGYSFSCPRVHGAGDSMYIGAPTIWRHLNRSDLINYFDNIRIYYDVIRKSCKPCGELNFNASQALRKYIEGLKYVTKTGMPEGFMQVYGSIGVHGGWWFETTFRNLEIEVAVLENIYKNPIDVGRLSFKSRRTYELKILNDSIRESSDFITNSKTIYPSRYLKSNEKIIIPIGINFSNKKNQNDGEAKKINFADIKDVPYYKVRGNEVTVINNSYFDKVDKPLFSKNLSELKCDQEPNIPVRYIYGPRWILQNLIVDEETVSIRESDWNNYNLYLGNEKGSCPFVYSKGLDSDPWLSNGHVLLGAVDQSIERTETIIPKYFNGTVQVRENEDEVTFLSRLTLKLYFEGQLIHDFDNVVDETNSVISRYNPVDYQFDIRDYKYDKAELSFTGFYIPFGSTKIQKEVASSKHETLNYQ